MSQIYLGKNELKKNSNKVNGEIVTIDDEQFYKISNYDEMRPFFISVVSESDLWMYISSNGALTAGRRNADNALFPYYTDDRIHDSQDITGSKTILLVLKDGKKFLWEPFSSKYRNIYSCESNIYKNLLGNKLIFEEKNLDLNVTFQYSWLNCDQFGFVKKSQLINHNTEDVSIEVLDGIQNLLPSGIDRKFQLEFSALVDGYKKNELIPEVGIGLYMLSSVPTDRAEPSESLIATTAWSTGLENPVHLISSTQLDKFRKGESVEQELDIRAERGAYILNSQITLESGKKKNWYTVIDINKSQAEVAQLSQLISTTDNLKNQIEFAVSQSLEALQIKISKADGMQLTNDTLNVFRHSANTMFNIMRGGIFDDDYLIDRTDFQNFISIANKKIAKKYIPILNQMPKQLTFQELLKSAQVADSDFVRLCNEYLPLSFSRRHGDPSRPWNVFSIDIKDENGNKKLNYQGNWRDIFQNWEALALSFPEYIESMITKFVNASTADGYNPYRVVREGFDWEILDPDDAWSYIGYWGDHQIIYLEKLLEISKKYHPGKLKTLLKNKIFTYANVPYKIKPYEEILKDPYNTVDFDIELNSSIENRVAQFGTDGKFVYNTQGDVFTVNLTEKLLVPALVKLSNFIPEAGIWMNTQRPEWNDANNALVGNGTSMVTLYYLRRYIHFAISLFNEMENESFEITDEVFQLFTAIADSFQTHQSLLEKTISDENRKLIVDQLSTAGSSHRQSIYKNGFSGDLKKISTSQLLDFFQLTLKYIDHSIKANRRNDDLFHAYNLINLNEDNISIRYLYEMLEGQVSVLSSAYLSTEQSLKLLKSLRSSSLYRQDQNSYILYPNRQLARFTEKNVISEKLLQSSPILNEMIATSDTDIVEKDVQGNVHFHSSFRNARLLEKVLISKNITGKDNKNILDIYESVFDHQSFTGRSGTFYKYEGLGSIYWHMVSKLLLSVQETYFNALATNASDEQIQELSEIYYEIRAGIGSHKNPADYGAFPTDPYSHTPGHCGVQQPGMTGQVKEDLLSRFGELGVMVKNGSITFAPHLLKDSEFLSHNRNFIYYNIHGKKNIIKLPQKSLAFTIAQVPVIYKIKNKDEILVTFNNNDVLKINTHQLNEELSGHIFNRTGKIVKIEVKIKS